MPHIVADRVQETSTTTGTGDITLAGATTGFQAFSAAMATGDTTYYAIEDQSGGNWEVGIGTLTASNTLARTTILSSSNSGSAVAFAAGTKNVFITYPAGRSVSTDAAGAVSAANGGTGAATLTANNVLLGNGTGAVQFVAPDTSGNVLTSNGTTWASTAPTANTELNAMLYGDGSDGALIMAASGTLTLSRDQYYSSVSWPSGSTANFIPNGFRIFVSGTLDLTNAPTGAFFRTPNGGGGGGSTGTGGGAASAIVGGTVGGGGGGASGGNGQATSNGLPGGSPAFNPSNGSAGFAGGTGGTGTAGAGAAGGNAATTTPSDIRMAKLDLIRGSAVIFGGLGGPGGGAGGGDGTTAGGGGGGGGSGTGTTAIFANTIQRGTSTNAWFQFPGGAGGAGGSATTGNRGGGGGGSGGNGGWIYVVYNTLLGTTNPNALQANGGAGGAGGNGFGTGIGGNGGGSGGGGRITKINALTGAVSVSVGAIGIGGSAASGVTGGAGAPATILTVSL